LRLSAFDCTARGISNLRGNWELVLLQLAQIAVFFVLTLAGVAALVAVTGVTLLSEIGASTDWAKVLERMQGFSLDRGLVAIVLAALVAISTIGALIYSWFQAGIFSTLERGELQAPPSPKTDWSAFRTFRWREFAGWSNRWTWRYFLFLGWFFLVATLLLVFVGLFIVVLTIALPRIGGPAAVALGCVAVLPVVAVMLGLNLWLVVAQALLPRQNLGVLGASRQALGVLRRRSGAALLLLLLFIFASVALSAVFWPLSQGIALAIEGSIVASLVIDLLLGAAQMLAGSILTIAFYGSIVALARTELDRAG
jgi:hypothetical protein